MRRTLPAKSPAGSDWSCTPKRKGRAMGGPPRGSSFPARELRPAVAQRRRPVQHQRAGPRVGVDAEVSLALELEARARLGAREPGLDAGLDDAQRVWGEARGEVLALRHVARVLAGKEAV